MAQGRSSEEPLGGRTEGLEAALAELRSLYEAEREARAAAEQRVEQVQQLQSITEVALSHVTFGEEVLGALLERVRAVLQADTAAILLIDLEGEALVARAARGLEGEVARGVRIPMRE